MVTLDKKSLLPEFEIMKVNDTKYEPTSNDDQSESIHKCVIGDFCRLDFVVTDEEKPDYSGRPFITFLMDLTNKKILGVHIDFDIPSGDSVFYALKGCLNPNIIVLQLIVDNGKGCYSKHLYGLCQESGIQLIFGKLEPLVKGAIESCFSQLIKGIYLSKEKVISLQDLRQLVFTHIDLYNNPLQGGTPSKDWRDFIRANNAGGQ